MKKERWKCRAVDTEENQRQVFLSAHSPWKSPKSRFPHSHRTTVYRYRQTKGGLAADRFAPAIQAHAV